MKLIIDENGKAVDLEDVSVTIIYDSKEEADRMKEGMASGRVQQLEWHPIEVRDDEEMPRKDEKMPRNGQEMPRDGETVLVTVRTGRGFLQTVWTTIDIYGRDGGEMRFASFEPGEVIAWAPMPQPYEKRED